MLNELWNEHTRLFFSSSWWMKAHWLLNTRPNRPIRTDFERGMAVVVALQQGASGSQLRTEDAFGPREENQAAAVTATQTAAR